MTYQVFVAEDEAIIRDGIRANLDATGRYTLAGEAADGEMAFSAILELKPDILITDIKMPFMDGLALSRAVKRAMPRTKIIIVSGHDEFDFAKQAISIGVDEYLLKPIRVTQLLTALDKIADRIEQDQNNTALLTQGQTLQYQETLQLRDGFFDELLTGSLAAPEALERAERFHVALSSKLYMTAEMELHYEHAVPQAPIQLRAAVDTLLADRDDALWCLRGRDRLILIAKGDEASELEHAMYEIAISVRDELMRTLSVHTSTCIGPVAERITGIAGSYRAARELIRRLPGLPDGAILDCSDFEKDNLLYMAASQDDSIARKLRYASREDIPLLMEQLFDGMTEDINSLLYGYYRIMDLLIEAARITGAAGNEPKGLFPELTRPAALLRAASDADELKRIAESILTRLIDHNEQAGGTQKYGDIIARAKTYIHDNYSDSSLSLNTVASYTGFSANHFSTVFSQNTGETFIGFLTRVRMEEAKRLLQTTDLSSTEIAYRLGYNDSNYFRYLFKKSFGLSPRDFRNSSE